MLHGNSESPRQNCTACPMRSQHGFCALGQGALRSLEAVRLTTTYPAGASIFVEGESPRGLYILCHGQVKLTMNSADGKTLMLRVAEPGQVLGLQAATSGNPYEFTAEALEPCQVSFVRRDDFLRMLRQHADVAMRTVHELCDDCRVACDQIRSLGLTNSAAEKVARLLLDWSEHGQPTNQGIRVELHLTHEEIGQLVGASRETVTRTLSEMRSKLMINVKHRTLWIRNKPALERLLAS